MQRVCIIFEWCGVFSFLLEGVVLVCKYVYSYGLQTCDELRFSSGGFRAAGNPPRFLALCQNLRPLASANRQFGGSMDTRSRGLRVHPNRKVAVASSELDFVSLSACDEDMVQECDKAARAEALKRRHSGGRETNKCQRNAVPRAPQSEHNSSQDISSELGQLQEFDGRTHFPTLKDPRRAPSCRFGESQIGGGSIRGSFGESLSSLGVSSSSGTSPRPRTADSPVFPGCDGASPHAFAMPSAMGRVRSLRLVKGTALSADVARPPSSLRSRCPSQSSLEASHRGLLSLSLSGVPTPHGVAECDVYEGHDLLVRCPAPKRPKRTNAIFVRSAPMG